MKHLFLLPLRFYRKFISPHFPAHCRFTPTCSSYAITAFERFGVCKGLYLTIWRVLRCNPFGKGGYDPVPETKERSGLSRRKAQS